MRTTKKAHTTNTMQEMRDYCESIKPKAKNAPTTKVQASDESKKAYSDILRTFETAYRKHMRNNTAESKEMLDDATIALAKVCTFSVLKKLANVGNYVDEKTPRKKPFGTKPISNHAQQMQALKIGLLSDLATLDNVRNVTPYKYTKNADGDTICNIDKTQMDVLNSLIHNPLTDGVDLFNKAVESILSVVADLASYKGEFLETPITIRRLKTKVRIQSADSAGGWETKEVKPIQMVYVQIRRLIESNRQVQALTTAYTYIERTAHDDESDTNETYYERLSKYNGIASESAYGIVTASAFDADELHRIISELNLTDKQMQILNLRLANYGYKAIATYLGVSADNVKSQVKEMRRKWTRNSIAKALTE